MDQGLARSTRARLAGGSLLTAGILLLSACASLNAPYSEPAQQGTAVTGFDDRAEIIRYAQSLQGRPYRYGGTQPQTGFDCSGLVCHVYGRYGFSLPRSSREMGNQLPEIPQQMLAPGDLVFFNTTGQPFSHVGIYIGEDKFIHAPSSRTGRVMISNLKQAYWAKRFEGARRPVEQDKTVARQVLPEPLRAP